jgi:hypothetical protein
MSTHQKRKHQCPSTLIDKGDFAATADRILVDTEQLQKDVAQLRLGDASDAWLLQEERSDHSFLNLYDY